MTVRRLRRPESLRLDRPFTVEVFKPASPGSIFQQFVAISLRSPQGLADVVHIFDMKIDRSSEGFDPGHVFRAGVSPASISPSVRRAHALAAFSPGRSS